MLSLSRLCDDVCLWMSQMWQLVSWFIANAAAVVDDGAYGTGGDGGLPSHSVNNRRAHDVGERMQSHKSREAFQVALIHSEWQLRIHVDSVDWQLAWTNCPCVHGMSIDHLTLLPYDDKSWADWSNFLLNSFYFRTNDNLRFCFWVKMRLNEFLVRTRDLLSIRFFAFTVFLKGCLPRDSKDKQWNEWNGWERDAPTEHVCLKNAVVDVQFVVFAFFSALSFDAEHYENNIHS